jgi:hypothetical protein
LVYVPEPKAHVGARRSRSLVVHVATVVLPVRPEAVEAPAKDEGHDKARSDEDPA